MLMGWYRIRKAKEKDKDGKDKDLDPTLRRTFEQYGAVTMQVLLATNTASFQHNGITSTVQPYQQQLFNWLTEQHYRARRKENWSLMMEFVLTITAIFALFVAMAPWLRDLLRLRF